MRNRIIEALSLQSWPFLIPDYTLMLTAALIAGALLTLRRCRRLGLPAAECEQTVFYILLLVLPCARLVYALQYPHQFAGHALDLFDPKQGGMALYGGMVGAIAAPLLLIRSPRFSPAAFLDAALPALGLGLFLGRIGCFLAGCNWGQVTALPWGVRFPGPHHVWAQHLRAGLIDRGSWLSLPVHPTQLYEAGFGLAVAVVAWRALPAALQNRERQPAGILFLQALSAYAVFRFLTEFLRADSGGVAAGPLTFAQTLSVATLLSSLVILWKRTRPESHSDAAATAGAQVVKP